MTAERAGDCMAEPVLPLMSVVWDMSMFMTALTGVELDSPAIILLMASSMSRKNCMD